MSVDLWMSLCRVPRLFAEVENIVCYPQNVDPLSIAQLLERLCHARENLIDWRNRYETLLGNHPANPSEQSIDRRYESLGSALGMLIVMNRLIQALSHNLAGELEPEAQSLANQIVDLKARAHVANPRAGVFMAMKMIIARATTATHHEWLRGRTIARGRRGIAYRLISEEAFVHWCTLKGRKIKHHPDDGD